MKSFPSLFALVACHLIFSSNFTFAAPAESQKDRQESINDFQAALQDSQYNFTDGDVGEAATRLFGWQGCNRVQRRAIYSGWQQSWKIMDAVKGNNLNWNEAAAIDYLAPPFINEEDQAAIKSMASGSLLARADLDNYARNKGRTWFHELLHIDWASGVQPGWHIKDMPATYTDDDDNIRLTVLYGAERTKALARYRFTPAYFIRRNADNFAMYAMAKYVQKAIGKYPHLPLAMTLDDVENVPSLFMSGGFSIDLAGKVTIAGPQDDDICQTSATEGGSGENQDLVQFNSSAWFWGNSVYPEDYQRQLRGWIADATPHHNRVRIVLMQTAMGPQWMTFQDTPEEPITDFCAAKILTKVTAEGDENNLQFPTKLPAFDAHVAKGCVYSGSSDVVGGMSCEDGALDIRCWEDPEWREMSECDGGRYILGIKCDWQ
ncbi:hypothetical protein ACHAP5_012286 [Fusarium lateritium]